MGNRALSAAIQHISMAAPQLLTEAYFSYALLMAADEDNNALAEPTKLKALLTLADHIDVYTNESDLAMFLSSLANFKPPLGWFGATDFKHLPSKSNIDRLHRRRCNLREQWIFGLGSSVFFATRPR